MMTENEKEKPKVYLASPVFREIADNPKVSLKWKEEILRLWQNLNEVAEVIESTDRFPTSEEIAQIVSENNVDFIGCHLSHSITKEILKIPSVKAITTSTAGFNHIAGNSDILITHTPSVLDKTVADFTIAIILANLRNLINLHNFLWSGLWTADRKWDL